MPLIVDFLSQRWELNTDAELSFGRAGDVTIDETNLYLHRVVGVFRYIGDTWWLQNLGDWVDIVVRTQQGSTHTLVPGSRVAIVTRAKIRFEAGLANYQLDATPIPLPADPAEVRIVVDVPSTNRFGFIELNDEQRLLLVALCEPRLTSEVTKPPPNRATAHRLGWSITKFNRKLDYLCRSLTRAGVPGLKGRLGERASDRRLALIDHAVSTGLVEPADLRLLREK